MPDATTLVVYLVIISQEVFILLFVLLVLGLAESITIVTACKMINHIL